MWIEPNGVVKILYNVDLDDNYDNTLYFANRTAQFNYFNQLVKYTYSKITYQRVKRNYIRVEINAENLYDCNYIMFQNTSFGNKWFYAFIKKVEYLSNMVSEIEYEIDVMQTWFWDCTMQECFIERQHSYTDNVGDNLIEENLELGEYVSNGFNPSLNSNNTPLLGSPFLVIASTVYIKSGDVVYTKFDGDYVNGIFTGLYYHIFQVTTQGVLNIRDFIEDVIRDTGSTDCVVDIFMIPAFLVPDHLNPSVHRFTPMQETYSFAKPLSSIDGYTPRNKKLLTYPFNFLEVIDVHGNEGVYQYEYFSGNNVVFDYTGAISCDPSMMITPRNYKGVDYNYNEKMVYKGFPHCSFDTDLWKVYLAQNVGTLLPTLAVGTALLASPPTGVTQMAGITAVANSLNKVRQAQIQGPQAKGNFNGDIIFSSGVYDFYYNKLSIRNEYAKIIDDYFDMFGYATKRVLVPNISSRPYWNYVKTVDANIVGSVPADDLKTIKNNFNKGITFWKTTGNIGDYTNDNRPV